MVARLSDAASWSGTDLELLRDAAGFRTLVTRDDLQIGCRAMPDDPNLLFRWRLSVVNAPARVVFQGFVDRILDYHGEWTREFVDGTVVSTPSPGVRVLHQRFAPGIPGIAKRDLCSAEVVRELPGGELLASFRSVDGVPAEPGHVRIDWWGAALCTPIDDHRTEMVYLDRENQGGRFPAWLMNRTMKTYLVRQAEAVQRFFVDGGPPELRREA